MVNNLYYWLFALLATYLGVLFLINRIPGICVKSLGFFSLKRLTIRVSSKTVHIKRLQLKINIFGKRDRRSKLVQLIISGVEVHDAQPDESDPPVPQPLDNPEPKKKHPIDVRKLISFTVPSRLYNLIYRFKLMNQCSISIVNFSAHPTDNAKFSTDYAVLDNTFNSDSHNSLVFSIHKGYLKSGDEEVRVFRNIDFTFSFDAITSVKDKSSVQFTLSNFSTSLFLGKVHIPLLLVKEILEARKDTSKPPAPKPKTPKKALSENDINTLREIWSVLNRVSFTWEDLSLSHGEFVYHVSSFESSLAHYREDEHITTNLASLKLQASTVRIMEGNTEYFRLASANTSVECHPLGILKGLEGVFCSKNTGDNKHKSDLIVKLTVTNPTINLYFDQILAKMEKSRNKKPSKGPALPPSVDFEKWLSTLQYVSTKIVIVDAKFAVHVPALGSSEFHRDSSQNAVFSHRVEAITQRFATKDIGALFSSKEVKQRRLHSLFKLKNYKLEVVENLFHISKCNVLVSYSTTDKRIALKVNAKNSELKSVNSAIFNLMREVRTRKINHYNSIYAELTSQSNNNISPDNVVTEKTYVELFEVIPSIVSQISVDIRNIQIVIICKDGLPKYEYFDKETEETVNLGDFRRGITMRLSSAKLKYNQVEEDLAVNFQGLQTFTMSEFAADYIEDFDVVTKYKNESEFSDISSLGSLELAGNEDYSLNKVKKVFNIDTIEISNFSNKQRDKNKLSVRIPVVDGRIDIFLAWCSIYAASLVESHSPKVERQCSKERMRSLTGKEEKILKLDVTVNSVAIVLRLPTNVDVMLELDTLQIRDVFESLSTDLKFFRAYVVHPKTRLWARCLSVKDLSCTVKNKNRADSFEVKSRGIRLNIPFGFEFYKVVDNIVTFAKAIRQIIHNFKNLSKGDDDFNRLLPDVREAFDIPKVNIKTETLGLTIENDPFETELSYIFELGLIEQKERIRKWKLFETKVEELQSESIESKIELTTESDQKKKGNNIAKVLSPLRNVLSDTKTSSHISPPNIAEISEAQTPLSKDEVDTKIENARSVLEEELSMSWVQKYKRFKSVKIENWKERAHRVWGEEVISDVIVDKFDILSYSTGPLLMGAVFRYLDFGVSKADVEDIDKFLYDFGKGQPKLDYSILIPAHLSVKSRGVFVFLKDYTLPLLSFPQNSDPNKTAFHLSGNVVINEKIVYRKEEMRFINVPFSPPQDEDIKSDTFYHTFVTRTLTPVKFMMDLKCFIDSDRAAIITWCESYKAALSASMMAVDKFTKPKIDDSPLGWWDKMALLCHGRVEFELPNELCLHMKSSGNPYDLTGRAAGFVFSWKNNVKLIIHDDNNPKELLKLESDDFLLAIPNYSSAEKRTWSLFYDEVSDDANSIDSETKKYSKKVMQFSSDEKVKWRLGLLFERNKGDVTTLSDENERNTDFIPHYDVIVTSPFFEWHPDSYKGFRSDYLHLAISVESTSKKGNASNSVHFTPLTFTYFFYWWDTLTKLFSLPVRQGKLFENSEVDESHISMSPHLFTVKYQLILEPLMISHMYMHSTGDKNGKIAFTGLKARTSKCIIDLHQRKEMLTYINDKLDIKNQTMSLKMNQAEIDFDNVDIRLVNAVFPDRSMKVRVAKYIAGSLLSPSDSSSGDNDSSGHSQWINNVKVYDGDYSWVDHEDFIELEVREVLSPYPKITVHPFAFSPRLTYIREFSLGENGPYPFGSEDSHTCYLGLENPEETQAKLLKKRLTSINQIIEENESLLPTGEAAETQATGSTKKINETIDCFKERRAVIENVFETITGNYLSDDASETHGSESEGSLSRSRSLSVYSTHKSINEWKEIQLVNKSATNFHNRFIVHNLQLKWNNMLRDLFLDYIQHVSDRRSETYFMSKKAVDLVESVINSVPADGAGPEPAVSNEEIFNQESKAGEDVINSFYEHLEEYNKESEEPENKFLVKLVHPQIQLVSQVDPNAATLIISKDLELRIVAINIQGIKTMMNESTHIAGLIETRYGGLFDNSSIFVFNREDTLIEDEDIPYGYVGDSLAASWPPWLETESVYENWWLKSNLIAHRHSMALTYRKPNFLYVNSSEVSQLVDIKFHLPKMVLTANSKQYSTLYYITMDLLMKKDSSSDVIMNKIEKVMALSDTEDFYGLDTKVRTLQDSIRLYHEILLKLDQRFTKLSSEENLQVTQVEMELEKMKLQLGMIMKGLRLKNSKDNGARRIENVWCIFADQVIWHLITDDGKPFVDIALANSKMIRLDGVDGSNKNQIEVSMVQGFNLRERATYPELLQPILEEGKSKSAKPVFKLAWQLLNPVGGIPIIQFARLTIQPLKLQLDYDTSVQLFEYLFPKSDHADESSTSEDDSHSSMFVEDESEEDISVSKRTDQSTPNSSLYSSHGKSDSFSSHRMSEDGSISNGKKPTKCEKVNKAFSRKKTVRLDNGDDISMIVARSSKYMSIMEIEMESVKLIISFKAPPHLNIIDVHNLSLNVPNLKYVNRIWSMEDIIVRLRKDVIKVVLQHSGKIIGNKFKVRKRSILSTPLKQISNYVSYVSVSDLQEEAETAANSERNGNGSHIPSHHRQHHNRHRRLDRRHSAQTTQTLDDMLQEIADEEDDGTPETEGSK